jgi:hypothetical protein
VTGPVRVDVDLAQGPVAFTLHGLSRSVWADLVHRHPSADPRWKYDSVTLFPELLQLCVTDPVLLLDTATAIAEDPDTAELVDIALRLTEPGSIEWAKRRLATDARLASEVALATRMGMPHDEFASWSITSQDLALAHAEMAAAVCPGCGVPEQDMRDPLAWDVAGRHCFHCQSLEQARSNVPEEERGTTHIRLTRPGAGEQ